MPAGILPLAAMEKILKDKGKAERVSADAKEALRDVLEEMAEKIGRMAKEIAEHANRTTVKADDIKLAMKR